MFYLRCLFAAVGLFAVVTILYRVLSKGLSKSAKGQQLTRFGLASLLAVFPFALAGEVRWTLALTFIAVVSAVWGLTYPVLDFIAGRSKRSEIDNRMDFAFGLYLFGFLSSVYMGLSALLPACHYVTAGVLAAVEMALLILSLFQILYFAIYGAAIDHDGLKLVLDTDVNEVLEFLRSFSKWWLIAGLVGFILAMIGWFYWNFTSPLPLVWINLTRRLGLAVYAVAMAMLMFRGRHSAFRRSGLPKLYFENRDHQRECAGYAAACVARRNAMRIESSFFGPAGEGSGAVPRETASDIGRTWIVVIGESASRDYLEAFSPGPGNAGTSPWLSGMAAAGEMLLFRNAYSCHFQTVPTLTRALTEVSQYSDKGFPDAVSLIDVAKILGMKTYWFSNQGHIGSSDTPVTLVAETADRAQWTSQTVNRSSYDGELPAFLESVDPAADKLIVFHLIGSHFTYANRYPAGATFFKSDASDSDGYVSSYRNSIRYTDSVLEKIFAYASKNLNLQGMVYFSDHGDIPDRRRSPVFDGFGKLRIPMAVYLSPEYRKLYPAVSNTLCRNVARPFSNDLLFNFICGLWGVVADFAPSDLNIASDSYVLTPSTTRVLLGEAVVADDPNYSGN
ncbi:MAG: phosphoethanolamine transferase [Bacteroidales bacterium]|nr:phosphoethanolamine transferase [Bacteroidales bacterium]